MPLRTVSRICLRPTNRCTFNKIRQSPIRKSLLSMIFHHSSGFRKDEMPSGRPGALLAALKSTERSVVHSPFSSRKAARAANLCHTVWKEKHVCCSRTNLKRNTIPGYHTNKTDSETKFSSCSSNLGYISENFYNLIPRRNISIWEETTYACAVYFSEPIL